MTKTKIIAEVASCHNGNLELAKALVRAAKDCGADIVKFQSWQARNVKSSDPDKKRYEKLELSERDHFILKDYCDEVGIEFLTSIFDINRISFLKELGLKTIKVPSTKCHDYELLGELAKNFEHIILSTGMHSEEEIVRADRLLSGVSHTLMHCTSVYPCPLQYAHLERIEWLKKITPSVGYSDHTSGTEAPFIAMSMGVDYLEKHFTLSRYLPQEKHKTRDSADAVTTHEIACEPSELREICQLAKLVQVVKGDKDELPLSEELETRKKYDGRLG